ncbi:MAG: His/Gly/Thr/Pro-type tRNA ligase C-terminal domain-containing protein, partial [Candidatus Nanohalobium sp.]
IEQNNDENGINWNSEVAAYDTAVIIARHEDRVEEKAEELYQELKQDEEVLLYDTLSVGEKFAESDLIGVWRKLILGNSFLEDGTVEIEDRKGETVEKSVDEVVN